MKITETKIKQFLRDAVVSFFFWTITLTPYMIFVIKVDTSQYMTWIGMQIVLVPPLGALSAVVFRWVDRRMKGDIG